MSTDAPSKRAATRRLGSPDMIAQLAAEEYGHRPFFRRHPLTLALLAPLPLLAVTFAGFLGILALAGWSMGISNPDLQPWTVDSFRPETITLMQIGYTLAVMAPFILSAWILCHLARRFHIVGTYSLLACTIVALVAVMFRSQLVLPASPNSGMLQFGFGYPAGGQLSYMPSHLVRLTTGNLLAIQAVQATLPILIGLYFIYRGRSKETLAT